MLWNKARRVIQRRSRAYHGLAFYHRQVEPGLHSECTATDTNILSTQRPPRRPCSTWRPVRCFGTKRGGIAAGHSNGMVNAATSDHRQVEPGLRSDDVAGFAKNPEGDALNRGQFPRGTVLVVQHLVGRFVVGEPLRLCIPIQSFAQRLRNVRQVTERGAAMTDLNISVTAFARHHAVQEIASVIDGQHVIV